MIIRMISRIICLIIPIGPIRKIQEITRKTLGTRRIEKTSQEVDLEVDSLILKPNEITMSSFSSPSIY